jgi:hypothetical protein
MATMPSWEWAVLSLAIVIGLNWYYWPRFQKVRREEPDAFLSLSRAQFLGAAGIVAMVTVLAIAVLALWAWRVVTHF